VRQIAGVAFIEGKRLVVFSLSGYCSSALEVGYRAGVVLFTYDFLKATLTGATPAAKQVLTAGLVPCCGRVE
jgi:hypothetical protein